MPRKGTTAARDYGAEHQRLRRTAIATMKPGTPCGRCRQPMWRDQALDLDHSDDRRRYVGLAHASCNRRAGARVRWARARARALPTY
jgi:hypothetical protein